MTATNANNASGLTPPPAVTYPDDATALRTFYFRQSGDNGANFTVTPIYFRAVDGLAAVRANPHEYATAPPGSPRGRAATTIRPRR